MDLNDYFNPKPDTIMLRATDRWEAIDELIAHLVVTQQLKPEHREAVAAAVKKREQDMSTGIGFEIAIPHASTELVTQVIAVIGHSTAGIQFDALDGLPVKKALLCLVPAGQFQKFAPLLANIAKLLHRENFADNR